MTLQNGKTKISLGYKVTLKWVIMWEIRFTYTNLLILIVLFFDLIVQALNYLPNLEECYAAGNRIKTIDLSRCKKLQDIDISKNRITDLSGLKTLPNLQVCEWVSSLWMFPSISVVLFCWSATLNVWKSVLTVSISWFLCPVYINDVT